jgi:hypothetical protein
MTVVAAVLLLGVAYIMLCRLHKMRAGVTHYYIAAQHGVLGLGAFVSALLLVVRPEIAVLPLAIGVMVFFLLSSHRWDEAPDSTSKPDVFDDRPHHWAGS